MWCFLFLAGQIKLNTPIDKETKLNAFVLMSSSMGYVRLQRKNSSEPKLKHIRDLLEETYCNFRKQAWSRIEGYISKRKINIIHAQINNARVTTQAPKNPTAGTFSKETRHINFVFPNSKGTNLLHSKSKGLNAQWNWWLEIVSSMHKH